MKVMIGFLFHVDLGILFFVKFNYGQKASVRDTLKN